MKELTLGMRKHYTLSMADNCHYLLGFCSVGSVMDYIMDSI